MTLNRLLKHRRLPQAGSRIGLSSETMRPSQRSASSYAHGPGIIFCISQNPSASIMSQSSARISPLPTWPLDGQFGPAFTPGWPSISEGATNVPCSRNEVGRANTATPPIFCTSKVSSSIASGEAPILRRPLRTLRRERELWVWMLLWNRGPILPCTENAVILPVYC